MSLPSRTIVPSAPTLVGDGCLTLLTFAPSLPTRPGPTARTPVGSPARFRCPRSPRPARLPAPFKRLMRLVRCQPGRPSFLSWGCPKMPLRRIARQGVHSRRPPTGCPAALPPSGWERDAPSLFRPRGFTPPRRLAPPWRDACIATRFRPWGSSRFGPVHRPCRLFRANPARDGASSRCVPALRSFPSVHSSWRPPPRANSQGILQREVVTVRPVT